jgi:hypothetical protein
VLLLDLPNITGLSGKVSGPVVIIENFPTDSEAERNLVKFLDIEANTLVVNSCKYIENVKPFSPKAAKRERLKLILNSENILKPKPKLPPQPAKKENKNFLRENSSLQDFSRILGMINSRC